MSLIDNRRGVESTLRLMSILVWLLERVAHGRRQHVQATTTHRCLSSETRLDALHLLPIIKPSVKASRPLPTHQVELLLSSPPWWHKDLASRTSQPRLSWPVLSTWLCEKASGEIRLVLLLSKEAEKTLAAEEDCQLLHSICNLWVHSFHHYIFSSENNIIKEFGYQFESWKRSPTFPSDFHLINI